MIKEFLPLSMSLHLLAACLAPTPKPSTCGVVQSDSNRISYGDDAQKNEFPWQVGLLRKPETTDGDSPVFPFCGGVLLDTETVLTAAHCLIDMTPDTIMVLVGVYDLRLSSTEQMLEVRSIRPNPRFRPEVANDWDYDFAIIKLSSPVVFSVSINKICLPDPQTNYDNRESTVTGWGELPEYNWEQPSILQKTQVRTMTNTACTSIETDSGYDVEEITCNMLCAVGITYNVDGELIPSYPTKGDSGGPLITLIHTTPPRFVLIGIVSNIPSGGNSRDIGVYARVISQLSWIQENMKF